MTAEMKYTVSLIWGGLAHAHALTVQPGAHAQVHTMHALRLHSMHLCSWLPAPGQIFFPYSLTTTVELGTGMLQESH